MKKQNRRLPLPFRRMLSFGRAKTEEAAKRLAVFYESVQKGRAKQVRRCLKEGMDPNWRYGMESMLALAARRKKTAVVKELLKHGANPNIEPGGPLILAVARGNSETARALIAAGANVNLRGSGDLPNLATACFRGNVELVDLLVKAGASLEKRCELRLSGAVGLANVTPLIVAVWQGHVPVVKLLLQAGAKPTTKDALGRSALDWARASKRPSAGKISALLQQAGGVKPSRKKSIVLQPDFSSSAHRQKIRPVIFLLKKMLGKRPIRLKTANGETIENGFFFILTEEKAAAFVRKNQQHLLQQGCFVFRTSTRILSANGVAVLPTTDQFEAIAALQTDGANFGIYNEDIVAKPRAISAKQAFVVTGIGFDFIQAEFARPVRSSRRLAKRLIELCPELGDRESVARKLDRTAAFFLWWD